MSGCVCVYFLPCSSTCLVTLTSCLTKVTDGQAYFGSQLKTQPVLGKLWNQELEAAPSIRKQCRGCLFCTRQSEPRLKVLPTFKVRLNYHTQEDLSS